MAKLVYIGDCVYKIVVAPRSKRKGKDIAWSVTECKSSKQTKTSEFGAEEVCRAIQRDG